MLEFHNFVGMISGKKVSARPDKRSWSLDSRETFIVKSLVNHLKSSYPIERIGKGYLKTKSPRRVKITIWIMIFGHLNCSEILQRKIPSQCLSPTVCHFCLVASETRQHIFFDCPYANKCWQELLKIFGAS